MLCDTPAVISLLTTGDTAYAMENYATAETAQKADTDPEGSFAAVSYTHLCACCRTAA